jgi:hypothetical protein
LDDKDFSGYLGQSNNLNSFARELRSSEKRVLQFINILSLFIFLKTLGLKCIQSGLGKSINMPSTLFVCLDKIQIYMLLCKNKQAYSVCLRILLLLVLLDFQNKYLLLLLLECPKSLFGIEFEK